MTWKNWNWTASRQVFLVGISIFTVVMLVVLYFDDDSPAIVKWLAGIVLITVLIFSFYSYTWITVKSNEVRFGFFPIYRKTVMLREIKSLSIVDVKPIRQYGGWGVRGWARTPRGLLVGGHPPRGLRIETFGNRRYIITPEEIEPVVQELARYGCTLSAGNGDDSSKEV